MAEHEKATGISNRESPEEEARERREHPPAGGMGEDEVQEAAPSEAESADEGLQTSARRGMRASAQQSAATRHGEEPAPSTAPVPGASGREPRE